MKLAELPLDIVGQMVGPIPSGEFESNGLTNCPDYVSGVDCRAAGHWHDWEYTQGGDETDREDADYRFYRNLIRCGLPAFVAGIEFRRVRLWGIGYFRYHVPPRGWHRIWLYFRCFVTRYVRF